MQREEPSCNAVNWTFNPKVPGSRPGRPTRSEAHVGWILTQVGRVAQAHPWENTVVDVGRLNQLFSVAMEIPKSLAIWTSATSRLRATATISLRNSAGQGAGMTDLYHDLSLLLLL
jgi:hypothetical protein